MLLISMHLQNLIKNTFIHPQDIERKPDSDVIHGLQQLTKIDA